MRLTVLAILLLACVATLPGLGRRDFWPPDEARYGGVSAEMHREGIYATPRLNDGLYPDKPPGYFWVVCAAAWITGGVDEATARFPAALGAILIVALVAAWAHRAGGPRAGFACGAMLLACGFFAWKARNAQLDLLFSALTAAFLLLAYDALEEGRGARLVVALLALGGAVLVKGPLALVGIVVLLAWKAIGRPPPIHGARLTRAALLGAIGAALIVGAWLARAVSVEGSDYVLGKLLGMHTIERATRGLAHIQPWWFYLARLPVALLPWLLLAPLWANRSLRAEIGPEGRRLARFALVWVVVFLAAMSVFPGKRSIYSFVVYPAFGLLLGLPAAAALQAGIDTGVRRYAVALLGAVAAILLLGGGFLLMAGSGHDGFTWSFDLVDSMTGRDLTSRWTSLRLPAAGGGADFYSLLRHLRALASTMVAAGVVVIACLGVRRFAAALDFLLIGVALTIAVFSALVAPHLDGARSRRAVAEAVREALLPGERLEIFRHLDEGVLFYLGRPLPEVRPAPEEAPDPEIKHRLGKRAWRAAVIEACERELVRYLAAPQPRACLIRRADLAALTTVEEGVDYDLVLSRPVGTERHYELIRNRTAGAGEGR